MSSIHSDSHFVLLKGFAIAKCLISFSAFQAGIVALQKRSNILKSLGDPAQFTSGKGSGEKFGFITADQVQEEEEEEDAAKFS